MTKIRLKMVLTLGVLAVLLTVSVAGSSLGISFTFGAKSSTAPPKITANATNVMRFYPYHHHTAPFHPPWRIVTPTPTPTPTTEPTATPTPSITPPASITPPPTPTARIPTQINVHVIPFSSTKGYMSGVSFGVTAKGGTIICNNGFVVEGFVDGSYIGQAKVTDSGACAQSMILDIPTSNLALGNHIVIMTFVGNAQYAPSATTCNLFVVA